MKRPGITAPRLFAVIAAMCIVGAATIATVMPSMLSLGQFVALADNTTVAAMQESIRARVSDWVWLHLLLPLMQRPAWLVPVSFGIIAAGVAVTLNSRQGAPRSRRKRS